MGAASLWLLLAGCALGPEMRMDEGALVSRAERAVQKPSAVLIPVTPQVVRQLGEAEALLGPRRAQLVLLAAGTPALTPSDLPGWASAAPGPPGSSSTPPGPAPASSTARRDEHARVPGRRWLWTE